jgi:hypothetical protein
MPTITGKSSVPDEVRRRRRVIAAAAITALGGLLFGYDTGVVSGALLFLKTDFGGLSSFQEELGVFLLFGFLTLVALAYFYLKVPETKGRSLQSIERDLRGLPAPPTADRRAA